MEIKDLRSTLVALFPIDEIDFKSLSNEAFSKRIITEYECARIDASFGLPIPLLSFGGGRLVVPGSSRVIDRIVIEERKIALTLGGSSQEAKALLDGLLEIISTFETRREPRPIVPVVEVDESLCVAKLDFQYARILKGSMGEHFIDTVSGIPRMAPEDIDIKIVPFSIRYKISYLGENASLKRHNIVLNEKILSLEMREGTVPDDQVFFISAPVKSDELLVLLRSLEEQMA